MIGLIKAVAAPLIKVIDDAVPDKDLANQLKAKLNEAVLDFDTAVVKRQADVIVAEASGSWLQRSWRPLLMLWFAALVGAHWMGFTPPNLPEKVILSLLDIVKIGIGGYVVGRSVEKTIKEYKQ